MTLEGRTARFERRDGTEALAFGGSDYLGLAHEPELRLAFVVAAERYGFSLAASRATTGTCAEHEALEAELAEFLSLPAALVVSSGSLANDVAAAQFSHEHERAFVHSGAHASLRDALVARVGRVHGFVDAADLPLGARLVALDGVEPLAGRRADLDALAPRLAADGWLWLDEAHSVGVLGPGGRGVRAARVGGPRTVVTGSFSKAFGVAGGFVAGPTDCIARARREPAFVGSTALSPALAAAARAALALVAAGDARRERLFRHVARVRSALAALGVPLGRDPFPVFALEFATEAATARAAAAFLRVGLAVPHVRYLGDRSHGALRLTLSAAHEDRDVDRLLAALPQALAASRETRAVSERDDAPPSHSRSERRTHDTRRSSM